MDPGGGGPDPPTTSIDKNVNRENVMYNEKDKGPFVVYIEVPETIKINSRFNNLKLAREIFDLNLVDVKQIKNKGTHRVAVEFLKYQTANLFVNNKKLLEKGYKIFIPFNFVTCKGIIRRVDLEYSDEELLKFISAEAPILQVRRLKRREIKNEEISYVPTGTVLCTFKGVMLPREVTFCNLVIKVEVYVSPVTQCYSCLLYGHTKVNCKSKIKCFNCASKLMEGEKHLDNENKFNCESKCHHCQGNHRSNYKKCPEYLRQTDIKKFMAYENVTFYDANQTLGKNYVRHEDFTYNPRDFPMTRKNHNTNESTASPSRNLIPPNERRAEHFLNNRNKRTFAQTISFNREAPQKKRIIYQTYDKDQHRQALLFPDSRPDKMTKTNKQTDPVTPTTSNDTNNENTPLSAATKPYENVEFDLLMELYQNFHKFPEHIKNRIKELVNEPESQTMDTDDEY